MPVEAQRRGVVAEPATTDFEDRPSEILYRLARMHIGAGGQDRADVHERGVALQHAVGDEHQPVANLQFATRTATDRSKRLHSRRISASSRSATWPAAMNKGELDWMGLAAIYSSDEPVLACAKRRVGHKLSSSATVSEAQQNQICA